MVWTPLVSGAPFELIIGFADRGATYSEMLYWHLSVQPVRYTNFEVKAFYYTAHALLWIYFLFNFILFLSSQNEFLHLYIRSSIVNVKLHFFEFIQICIFIIVFNTIFNLLFNLFENVYNSILQKFDYL